MFSTWNALFVYRKYNVKIVLKMSNLSGHVHLTCQNLKMSIFAQRCTQHILGQVVKTATRGLGGHAAQEAGCRIRQEVSLSVIRGIVHQLRARNLVREKLAADAGPCPFGPMEPSGSDDGEEVSFSLSEEEAGTM